MADNPHPRLCPAYQWCNRNNKPQGGVPCYCEDAGTPIPDGGPAEPGGPGPGG